MKDYSLEVKPLCPRCGRTCPIEVAIDGGKGKEERECGNCGIRFDVEISIKGKG